ncbi:hypothetical protein CLIB1423_11S03950 [[Candida] railenensis]|uniref:Cyclin-D1-binding protein 1-like N-terminal domain-containing protein n=1 Tax=[Candida] railenensis TaxID=45579 RepID=A0A9P0VZ34_9ASCO|nr:hypothetical protein CLIB1423_11S03950 [[Candida] railenensis]
MELYSFFNLNGSYLGLIAQELQQSPRPAYKHTISGIKKNQNFAIANRQTQYSTLKQMPHNKPDINALLKAFDEAVDFWLLSLGRNDENSSTSAAKVANPLEELSKLVKLIKAHTTKVGIIFKPSTLVKETSTAYNTFQKLSESITLMVSVLHQLEPKVISDIFYDELIDVARLLLGSAKTLVHELSQFTEEIGAEENEGDEGDDNEVNSRLVSIGQIWSHCDSIGKIISLGSLGVLGQKLKRSIGFIDDGLEDFEEWAKDPQDLGDDPFGFGDDEEEEEDENEEDDGAPSGLSASELDILSEYSTAWVQKFKLIKLLLTSITRSLPELTSGETVDKIYSTQRKVVANVDKLIAEVTFTMEIGDSCKECANSIEKGCTVLVKEVRQVNKKSESKVKWCDAWEAKFFQKSTA